MTQRNPMNDRYQEELKGKTRKSAASAKPKTKAASSVRMQPTTPAKKTKAQKAEEREKKRAEEQKRRQADARTYHPDTPEYKKWRKFWWISVISAGVTLVASFLVQHFFPEMEAIYITLILITYVFIIFGLWTEFWKLRRLRNAYSESMRNDRSKEVRRAEKQQKQQDKKAQEAPETAEVEQKSGFFSEGSLKNLTKKITGKQENKPTDEDTKGK